MIDTALERSAVYQLRNFDDANRTAKKLYDKGAKKVFIKHTNKSYEIHFNGSSDLIKTGRSGLKYTTEEDIFVLNFYLAGLPVEYLAKKTHRKESGIISRLKKHGFYLLDTDDTFSSRHVYFFEGLLNNQHEWCDVGDYLNIKKDDLSQRIDFLNYFGQADINEFPDDLLTEIVFNASKRCDLFESSTKAWCISWAESRLKTADYNKSYLALLRHLDAIIEYYNFIKYFNSYASLDVSNNLIWHRLAAKSNEVVLSMLSSKKELYGKDFNIFRDFFLKNSTIPENIIYHENYDVICKAISCWGDFISFLSNLEPYANKGNKFAAWLRLSHDKNHCIVDYNNYRRLVDGSRYKSLLQDYFPNFTEIGKIIWLSLPYNSKIISLMKKEKVYPLGIYSKNKENDYEIIDSSYNYRNSSLAEADSNLNDDDEELTSSWKDSYSLTDDWGTNIDDLESGYWESYLGG